MIDLYSILPYSSKHASKRRKIYDAEKYDYLDARTAKYDSQKDKEKAVQTIMKKLELSRKDCSLEQEVFD